MARLSKKNEELLRAVQKQTARQQHLNSDEASALDTDKTAKASADVSMVGLGVDLVEIERMEQAIKRTPRILERVFTSGERAYAWNKTRPAVQYAQFFAAREAVVKALGTGFAGIGYADVEVTHNEKGKPEVVLHKNARAIAQKQGIIEIQISLSHTHQMAVASAVAIKAKSSPRKVKALDPTEELMRQFKELRSMLDDLGVGGRSPLEKQEDKTGLDRETATQTSAHENTFEKKRTMQTEQDCTIHTGQSGEEHE